MAIYGGLWIFDLFITSTGTDSSQNSNRGSQSGAGTTQATTTLPSGGMNSEAPTAAPIGSRANDILVGIFQILRFSFIYLIPPYGLTVSAVQIEGVCNKLFHE